MNKNLSILAIILVLLGIAGYVLYQNVESNSKEDLMVTTTVTAVEQNKNAGSPLDAELNKEVQENQDSKIVENKWEGTHIMADGTIMTKAGEKVSGAIILANGEIRMSDATIVTPAFDLRNNGDTSNAVVDAPKHVVIDVVGIDFEYDIKQIKVKKGDTVTINFKSNQGFHDWAIDEFRAFTKRVNEGEGITSVTFIADKVGTFQYYCSVMNHRQMGMLGYLIVEER